VITYLVTFPLVELNTALSRGFRLPHEKSCEAVHSFFSFSFFFERRDFILIMNNCIIRLCGMP